MCVVISKGQQQLSIQRPQYQQQFTDLFASSNKPKPQVSVQIQEQPTQQQDPLKKIEEQSFRPITFPSAGEVLTIAQNPTLNTNSIQNAEQKIPEPIYQELTRPTRVAIAASVQNNLHTDDQFDYVRDFAWTLFQVI